MSDTKRGPVEMDARPFPGPGLVDEIRAVAAANLGQGVKYDGGKDPWDLFPTDAARGIVKVLSYGAGKYQPRNWEKGMAWSRCYSALLRHLFAWWEGENKDPETGFSHLWHAGCCLLFLTAYEIRGIGKDDRPTA